MKITLLSLLWHLIPFMTLHGKLVEKATVSFCPVKPTSENIGSSPGEPGKRGIKGKLKTTKRIKGKIKSPQNELLPQTHK